MRVLPTFALDIFPFPGQQATVEMDEDSFRNLTASYPSQEDRSLVIYIKHKLNVEIYGVEMNVLGAGPIKGDKKRTLYLSAKSIVKINHFVAKTKANMVSMSQISHIKKWDIMNFGKKVRTELLDFCIRKDIKRYKQIKHRRVFNIFEILNIISLTNMEKLRLLHQDRYKQVLIFLVNTFRFRKVLATQQRSIQLPLYLN